MAAKGSVVDEARIGSVKAAINMYGQTTLRTIPAHTDSAASKPLPVVENLHKSRKVLGTYSESKKASESSKAEAEAELSKAKNMVKKLTLLIERSSRKAKSQKREMESLNKSKIQKDVHEDGDYFEVMRELKVVKQQLAKLNLDIAAVMEEKSMAEKEIRDLGIMMEVNSKLVESLCNEIEVANEEHVLVELAKIEALKEYEEIKWEREKKGEDFMVILEETEKKIKEMMEEIERSKEIERELSETDSDIEMLETQLKFVKEMERKVRRSDSMSGSRRTFEREKDNISVLKEVTEKIEAKKEELSSINSEIFQLMELMDALRSELIRAKQEMAKFDKIVHKYDLKIEKLNAKLLIAKSKLEAVHRDEERANSLAANLIGSLEKLKADKDAAKNEEHCLKEETCIVKAYIRKTDLEIEGKEKELAAKLNELEKMKKDESLVLGKLESFIENTMENRETGSQNSLTIKISRFEYEYLTGQASHAKETAEKKVEAAEAWIEALECSQREITIKTNIVKRANELAKIDEERQGLRMKRSMSTKRKVEKEIQKIKEDPESKTLLSGKVARKSIRLSGKFTPTRRVRTKRVSMANGTTPTFFIIKKKKKVSNLVKFFKMKP